MLNPRVLTDSEVPTASRDELLSGEIFYTLKEAKVLVEQRRIHYNTGRPHSALGYRPLAPQAFNPLVMPASATQQ